ncbi:guanine nucleotide-binding protein subunit gamma 4-like [Rosa rugosa]|uniref:guanine nucleotide-binding protein subunit gamma 4-like n=1 Tax=Rosa rugosa TaxID=74645 RepID=UPI002B418454|nr:guanine nucleotide-binding protein subunit gamma 4-like [Rosa rugosa]
MNLNGFLLVSISLPVLQFYKFISLPLLLEELKSVECLQPASRCCKEIADFVTANPDPLIPTNRKKRRSCLFWKWLWYHLLFTFHFLFTIFKRNAALLLR